MHKCSVEMRIFKFLYLTKKNYPHLQQHNVRFIVWYLETLAEYSVQVAPGKKKQCGYHDPADCRKEGKNIPTFFTNLVLLITLRLVSLHMLS